MILSLYDVRSGRKVTFQSRFLCIWNIVRRWSRNAHRRKDLGSGKSTMSSVSNTGEVKSYCNDFQ